MKYGQPLTHHDDSLPSVAGFASGHLHEKPVPGDNIAVISQAGRAQRGYELSKSRDARHQLPW